ncbi:MAG: T9SS type A sorting domain-containing protein [Spirosomataceae bacterium]
MDDTDIEGSETATLTIFNPSAGITLGGTTTQNVTITDNDFPQVNLSVSANSGSEAGATAITVTATTSQAVVGDQTVSLGVSGTNITAGDYTLSNTNLTILNGQTTGTATFTIVDDTDIEGSETATLTIFNPSAGITLGSTTTQNVTITDNDFPPVNLICPINAIAPACQTQATINIQFANWLASVSASGGCNGLMTNNSMGAPPACGGSTTVTFTYTSTCVPLSTTCQATFTVPTCSATPTISTNDPTAFCPGSSVTLTSDAVSGNQWYVNGNPIDGATNQSYSATAAGNYTVVVTVSGCASEPSNSIVLTIKPVPTATLSASQTDVCPNTQVTLNAQCSLPAATVNWNPGAPTVIPDAATTSYVYKASCSFDGCTGNEASVEVRTHRILVDMKEIEIGTLPRPFAQAVKDNLEPTNYINAPAAPRRWTFVANGCAASESAVFRLSGPVNFSSIDNGAPYALFANVGAEYFTIDHPNYGTGGSFPNGTYTLTIDLRSQDGVGGPFPKNRAATGILLATRTLQFTVANQQFIVGNREGLAEQEPNRHTATDSDNRQRIIEYELFAQVMPNPVSTTMHLNVNEVKGQKVNVSLADAAGRLLLQRAFAPQTNQHQEEFEVSHLASGMYFLRVKTTHKQATVKVVKVP